MPDQPGGLGAVEIGDGRAASPPLLGSRAARARPPSRSATPWTQAVRRASAVEPMPRDEVEDDIGRRAGEAPQPLAALGAELRLDLVRIVLQARNDLAAVAARRAPAGRMRVEHDDVRARLGEVQRRRQPEIARADDEHVARECSPSSGGRPGACDRALLPEVGVPAHAAGLSSSAA